MQEAFLSFECYPQEEHSWEILITASNGMYNCAQEFHIGKDNLRGFAERLGNFAPQEMSDEVSFRDRADRPSYADHLNLRAFPWDRRANMALEVEMGSSAAPPYG